MKKTAYMDKRGWKYKVMPGIGGDMFKPFYHSLINNGYHPCRNFYWRSRFDYAQSDLDLHAVMRGWEKF